MLFKTLIALAVNGEGEQLDVYSPGAAGNTPPTRILAISQGVASSVALDQQANMYVNVASQGKQMYSVYAAGTSGSTAPLATFSETDAQSLAFSGSTLYGASGRSITAFATPMTNPTPTNRYCTPAIPPGKSGYYNYGIAVDILSSRLFAAQRDGARSRIAIFALARPRCPGLVGSVITAKGSNYESFPGIAFSSKYLFVTSGNVAFQFNAKSGVQSPVATMKGFSLAYGLALGP